MTRDPGDPANVVSATERGDRAQLLTSGAEHLGDRIHDEGNEPRVNVNDDPLRPSRDLGLRQAEANAKIDDRHHFAPIVGHARHRPRRLREGDELKGVCDLAHEMDRHRVMDVADDEADEILRGIVALSLRHGPPLNGSGSV